MAKKNYFEDIIPEDDILKRYPSLKDEVKKEETTQESVLQKESSVGSDEISSSKPVKTTKRGRPRKENPLFKENAPGQRLAHIHISQETRVKLRLYASCVSIRDGHSLTLNDVISRAIDHLIEIEFPDMKKGLNR